MDTSEKEKGDATIRKKGWDWLRSRPRLRSSQGVKTYVSKENGEKMGSCSAHKYDVMNLLANDVHPPQAYLLT